mgnify:FL=1
MSWIGKKPTSFTLDVIKNCEDHVKKVAAVGLQAVVVGSPVMDGAYRGNHRISRHGGDNGFDPDIKDKGGQSTITKGQAEIVKFKLGDTLYIQNNAPYAVRIENGWSQGQAPNSVYSIAFMNMRNV